MGMAGSGAGLLLLGIIFAFVGLVFWPLLILAALFGVLGIILIVVGLAAKATKGAYKLATTSQCPYCRTRIASNAVVCPTCHRDLDRTATSQQTTSGPTVTSTAPAHRGGFQRNEILDLLDNLDRRLAEGLITQDLYRDLKTKYETQLSRIEKTQEQVGGEPVKYCSKCGKSIPGDFLYCSHCGAKRR